MYRGLEHPYPQGAGLLGQLAQKDGSQPLRLERIGDGEGGLGPRGGTANKHGMPDDSLWLPMNRDQSP